MTTARRQALVAGATGLVGRAILDGLLADSSVAVVHGLARRPLQESHPKLQVHAVDFAALPALPRVDEAYLALGTTIKVAGSQAAFRAVDFDANLAVARAAMAAGATRIGVVSAMGADAGSGLFYNRVKGELEDALAQLPLQALVIARPSLLVGDRTALGQPERRGERIGLAVSNLLGFLIPENLKPIAASSVARALLSRVPLAEGRELLLSGAMQQART
jgi:uncharacterized protein YbjT (DUF2867 family)